VRLELPAGHEWIPRLIEAFPDRIESITLGKPTLEDVFIHVTGHRFWNELPTDNESASHNKRRSMKTRRQGDKETRR
jgi:ABC-2 type transport system ATP-binding protein